MGMRAFAVLVLCASVASADAPKLEDALARAGQRGVPLLVEFRADWCRPCREFEQRVLPSREVVEALAGVEVVTYDIEHEPGPEVAARYRVDTVPTFLVIDPEGKERMRRVGVGTGTHWFVELATEAKRRGDSTGEIEAKVAAQPDRAAMRLRLAERYRVTNRVAEAIQQYRAIDQIPNVHRNVQAYAAAALDELTGAEARVQAAVDAAVDFATRFPESRLTSRGLALVAVSKRVEDARVRELVASHVAAVARADLADAAHVAMLVGATAEIARAARATQALIPHAAEPRLVAAELALLRGDGDRARKAIETVCRPAAEGVELWCHTLTLARPGVVPGVEQLRGEALATLDALEHPGRTDATRSLTRIARDAPWFANAVARVVDTAALDCNGTTKGVAVASVAIAPSPRGMPREVRVMARDPDLEDCLRARIAASVLPDASGLGTVSTTVRVDGVGKRIDRGLSGGLFYAAVRDGALEAQSLGVEVIADGPNVAPDLRVVLSVQGEIGVASDGTSTWAMRGLLGLGLMREDRGFALLAGGGFSRYGAFAAELPLEARARLAIGSVRVHAWIRTTFIAGHSSRQSDGLDELAIGALASLPSRWFRLAVGGVYEHRASGTTGVVVFGLPLGTYF